MPIGTKVRIQLDNPKDFLSSKTLHGSFRVGDVRWEPEVRVITRFYLGHNFPPMYEVDNNQNVVFTKNQLRVVSEHEKLPVTKQMLVDKFLEGTRKITKLWMCCLKTGLLLRSLWRG